MTLKRSPMSLPKLTKAGGLTGILRVASHDMAAKPVKGPRQRKCKVCRTPFIPRSAWAKVCCPECGLALAATVRLMAERKKDRARKQALKSRADYLKEAQAAVNAFRRAEDDLAGLPCVSCGRMHTGQWHAGHFLSVGAHPEIRFLEINIWRQCKPCNVDLSGNVLLYRKELIKRIGIEKVEFLEGPHPARKYTISDALAIKAEYKLKLKELQA